MDSAVSLGTDPYSGPLPKLKIAMEEFSGGNTEIRLQDHTTNREITVLYRTFNHMAEQIINLKN